MAIVTKLQDFNLLDMLQLISMGNRSAIVRLHTKGNDNILAFSHGYLTGIMPCDYDIDDDYKEFLTNSISNLIKSEIDEYNQNAQLLQILPEPYQLSITNAIKNKFFQFLALPNETEAEIVFRQDWDNLPLCVYPNLKSINLLLDSCKHMASKEEISKSVNENTVFAVSETFNANIELDTTEKMILEAIDGVSTCRQIGEKYHVDTWDIIKVSYNLYRAGALINTTIAAKTAINSPDSGGLVGLDKNILDMASEFDNYTNAPIQEFISTTCQSINNLLAHNNITLSIKDLFEKVIKTSPELEFFETTEKTINYKDFIDNLAFFNQEADFEKKIKRAFYTLLNEIITSLSGQTGDKLKEKLGELLPRIKNSIDNI